MAKKYFHKLKQEKKEEVVNSENSAEKLCNNYKQPDWCSNTEALYGIMPCTELLSGHIETIANCAKCQCVNKEIIPIDCNFCLIYSEKDEEWVGLCSSYPSLSFLDKDKKIAFAGILEAVASIMREKADG